MAVIVSKGIALPSKVDLVKYIESTGTQYIDIGFKPNNNTRIDIVAEITAYPGNNLMLFGTRSSASTEFFAYYYPNNGYFYGRYAASQVMDINDPPPLPKRTISLNKNVFSVDSKSKSGTYASFQCTTNAILFGWNDSGSVANLTSMRLYSCQVYDDGVIIRDFWPCTDPSGVACLCDLVEKKYYYNAGTGQFIAGEAV